MARGAPDFGAVAPRTLTAPVMDSGELAARMGSPVVSDRLGTVIGLISGSQLYWGAGVSPAGATARVDVVPKNARFSSYSLRLRSEAAADFAWTQTQIGYLGEGGSGLEALYYKTSGTAPTLQLSSVVENGTDGVEGRIRYDADDAAWKYWNSAGAFVDTPTQPANPSTSTHHSIKVSLDPDTGLYLRGLADGEDLGVRGIAGQAVSVATRRFRSTFTLLGPTSGITQVWLSHVIFTANEI